jgi:hypothetical protein
MDSEWSECSECSGSGRDPASWDGRCIFCDGKGERLIRFDEEPDDGCGDPECCP